MISSAERQRLRQLAEKQLEVFHSEKNQRRVQEWMLHNACKGQRPMIHVETDTFEAAEVVEDAAAPTAYTADMSVEDICERMTLDDARSVVVDIGTCKGWTLEQVAERRAPSLKFYVRGCSDANNILKAAATLKRPDNHKRRFCGKC